MCAYWYNNILLVLLSLGHSRLCPLVAWSSPTRDHFKTKKGALDKKIPINIWTCSKLFVIYIFVEILRDAPPQHTITTNYRYLANSNGLDFPAKS